MREFRAQFDSTYAALYYPWVEIVDPTAKVDPTAGPALLQLPPAGFAAGIYARSDIDRGVHKAPANEVVLGITKFMHERHLRPAVGAQPRGHQRAAVLRGPGKPGVGRAHDELGPGVEVRQRPAAVQLPRALHRPLHAVGRLRAQQRAALGQHPADASRTSCSSSGEPAR